jgi:hypothetical protein
MGLEHETMTLIHIRPVQLEVLRGASALKMVPPVGEQDAAHIYK